jgi:hypothetical protein
MSSIGWLMVWLFFPASLGLVRQAIVGEGLAFQLLAIAFLLFSVEQTRMARVDLEQIAEIRQQMQDQQAPDERLKHFYRVTIGTIALELIGFYMAAIWLGWGAVLVLLSQVWFNCFANIQLYPADVSSIRAWGISQRIPVLVADGIGLVLVSLWMANISSLWMASGILSLAIGFGIVKYVVPLRKMH